MRKLLRIKTLLFVSIVLLWICLVQTTAKAGDSSEFTGRFETALIPNEEDLKQIVFKPVDRVSIKMEKPIDVESIAVAKLYDAPKDKFDIPAALIEVKDGAPVVYADFDNNGAFAENERFELVRDKPDNDFVWHVTLPVPFKSGLFASFPLYLNYYRGVQFDEMQPGEKLMLHSTEAFARGAVAIKGKDVVVQYGFDPKSKKIAPTAGWLGVDADGDNRIEMDGLSPEAAKARDETVVFRVGQTFVSTKKVDLDKNLIVMREHAATDYKRLELRVGEAMPDFAFTDFDGKKRNFSEFRGKFVLLDFWGVWCPACRYELPYLKTAYTRFQARDFEILGMNTDEQEPAQLNAAFKKAGINWTQARLESIVPTIKNLRVSSFPTTLLIDANGKIVSMGRESKNQPGLRKQGLLKTLDKILPP